MKESREVVKWKLEETGIKALLNLEKTNRPPSPTLSGGYRRLEGEGISTLLVGLAIPIPLFNRNQGNISSLRWQSEAVKSAQEQPQSRIHFTIENDRKHLYRSFVQEVEKLKKSLKKHLNTDIEWVEKDRNLVFPL
ncbi:MAG: hypothetical protein ACE5K8_09470, partial [Candidatus Zixiibacteriota bacterium]